MIRSLVTALAIFAAAPLVAGCAGTAEKESTGEYIDSSVISTKVRTAIASNDKLSIFDIDVTTFRSVVQLSGFVKTAEEKALAERIAANTEGVTEVRNNIEVRPDKDPS